MAKAKKSKLLKFKADAHEGTFVKEILPRAFDKDLIKHYIREYYWKKQIDKLIRARGLKKINYFSLCADTAYDIRLFSKYNLVDFENPGRVPFAFCESDQKSFDILRDVFKSPSKGFYGKLEDISTDVTNVDYGKFWGSFPFDVINLDFWGDIHKGDEPTKNVFYTIQSIILQQAHLRKQYELWITWRAKSDRISLNIKHAYKEIIKYNYDKEPEFQKLLSKFNRDNDDPLNIGDENVVNIGFIKWLLYITNRSFSVINKKESEILYYNREDKDGNNYKLYNFLLRISPYEHVEIPSPACAAAIHCYDEYKKNLDLCFKEPIDIDKEFKRLTNDKKEKLKNSLDLLHHDYINSRKGFLR